MEKKNAKTMIRRGSHACLSSQGSVEASPIIPSNMLLHEAIKRGYKDYKTYKNLGRPTI
jgi:hypothetical protein